MPLAIWNLPFTGCGKTLRNCHSERSEESGPVYFREHTQSEILRAVYPERQSEILLPRLRDQNDSEGLRMTTVERFSAACFSPTCHLVPGSIHLLASEQHSLNAQGARPGAERNQVGRLAWHELGTDAVTAKQPAGVGGCCLKRVAK